MTATPSVEATILPLTTLEDRAKGLKDIRARNALFNGLLDPDPKERAKGLHDITQLVKNWAKEAFPPKPLETAGTVPEIPRGGDGNESGVSSPLNNYNSSKRSSISDGNNTLYSPLFTDGSGSASASSYAPSPILDLTSESDRLTEENEEEKKLRSQEYLGTIILTMLRMSVDCPFVDVRNTFKKTLNKLRLMKVPVPVPITPFPSSYIAPEEIITLEWPSEYAANTLDVPRPVTPTGQSSPCSSFSSNSSSFTEEIPRIIQQPLTPLTPSFSVNSPKMPIGKQPDELVKKLMVNTFVKIGRLSHFYRILAYFPSFMEKYQDSYNAIVRIPTIGTLLLSWRFYIGIMAASQHKCRYVVSKLTDDFLSHGGNVDWLQGLQHAPTKIRKLAKLNAILAHQPWRLQSADIAELVRGPNPKDNWTTPEIVHVIVILSTFHGLSSYVLGCGIVPEYDSIGGYKEEPSNEVPEVGIMDPSKEFHQSVASGIGINLGQEQSEKSNTIEPSKPIDIPKTPLAQKQTADIESLRHTSQLIQRLKAGSLDNPSLKHIENDFENVEQETFTDELLKDELPFPLENFPTNIADSPTIDLTSDDFSKFLDNELEISYEDFDTKSSDYEIFKLGDYSWETHGVTTMNEFLKGAGELLAQEFIEVREFTDYRLFHSYESDMDTKPFRLAIWYYILRLYGLREDGYDYRGMALLSKKFKVFLKKVCCTPEKIVHKDWRNVGFQLREEEKCHVNLIAVEARKQAELIYGLSCVIR